MTTLYSQSTPSFLQKYTKTVFNRVHYNAHHDSHNNPEEAAISLQVSYYLFFFYPTIGYYLLSSYLISEAEKFL